MFKDKLCKLMWNQFIRTHKKVAVVKFIAKVKRRKKPSLLKVVKQCRPHTGNANTAVRYKLILDRRSYKTLWSKIAP